MRKRPGNLTFPLLFTAAVTTLLLTGCNGSKGDAAEGKRWYAMHNCTSCHGENANDGRAAKIAAIDMSFSSFLHILRKPYSPSMPPFPESKLPKEDAADIYAWLKTVPK